MKDMSINGAAASLQQSQAQNQNQQAGQADQTAISGGQTEESALVSSLLSQKEEESKNLVDMIREAQEKADAQREAMKLPKNNTRYGDAPLEAYARLARARSSAEVNSASGYARRRLSQFKCALRTDPENAAKIKAAINQLQKAIHRGERKKRELSREHLAELRRKRAAEEDKKQLEMRLKQELVRKKTQRMIRESGYSREAEVSNRLAAQLTAAQIELRQQAQELSASAGTTTEAAAYAAQQYVASSESAAAPPADVGFSGEA